jgi:hypothetical protein
MARLVPKEAARVAEALQETIRKQKPADLQALLDTVRNEYDLRLLQELEEVRVPQSTDKNRELLDQQTKSDPLQQAEAALKALREARDTEAQRKAVDALEKVLQKLRAQQKKQEGPAK